MTKLTKVQENALLVARTLLNPRDPANTTSDEVKAHLLAIENWMTSWVIPALDSIEDNSYASRWMRESTARDAALIRRQKLSSIEK